MKLRLATLALVLSTSLLSACDEENQGITDSNGSTNLQVPASQLAPNGCPYPEDMNIKDSSGNPLHIVRVDKAPDGSCIAVTRDEVQP